MENFTTACTRTESRAVPLGNSRDSRLLHAAMGITTEAGEFFDPLKKYLFYGKQYDEVNLREELGDLLWYIAIACDALDTTVELEMARVLAKLQVRYPDKFEGYLALNRDLEGERAVLEQPNGSSIEVGCSHDWEYTGYDRGGSHKGEDHYRCRKCGAGEYRPD